MTSSNTAVLRTRRRAAVNTPPPGTGWLGLSFVHPLFDYLAIGGGLSLLVTGALLGLGWNDSSALNASFPVLYLLFNSAHFAASTVRLYTKRRSLEKLPFLTMGVPLVSIGVLLLALTWPGSVGYYINKVYLTWSPFHYAATAYGLALIYAYRSGQQVSPGDKRLLRWGSNAPFLYALGLQELNGVDGWFLTAQQLQDNPALATVLQQVTMLAACASFVLPVVLCVRPWLRGQGRYPLMVPLLLVSNGIWWIVFTGYMNAFNMATVFHGLQYLAIVSIFHVKEKLREPDNRRGALHHTVAFYGTCLLLAVALFQCWPYGFVLLGFGKTESVLLVIAIINIHHFIVDAYIWKLKSDPNYKNVVRVQPATTGARS